MASLETVFGTPMAHVSYRTPAGNVVAPQLRLPDAVADLADALAEAASAPPRPESPFLDLVEACELSGLRPRTLRNLLHARDPLLLAARLPGKGYRFQRELFLSWVKTRPDYARLPGVRRARRKG